MDFSQADSAAETTSCPFLSFHYIYDFFINKTGKNTASQILQATSFSENQSKMPNPLISTSRKVLQFALFLQRLIFKKCYR